jgi:hypothetical protein
MRLNAIVLAALRAVLFASSADARPRHRRHHIVDVVKMVGCSDPVMRLCNTGFEPRSLRGGINEKANKQRRFLPDSASKEIARSNTVRRRISSGLRRVMVEGAGMVANWVKPGAWCGWWVRKHLGVADPVANLARSGQLWPAGERRSGNSKVAQARAYFTAMAEAFRRRNVWRSPRAGAKLI